MLRDHLQPKPGTLTIAMMLGSMTLIARCPMTELDRTMRAIERRLDLTAGRTDRMAQMRLRVAIVDRLERPDPLSAWEDWAAAASLWLFVEHHAAAGRTRAALDDPDMAARGAILSIGIGRNGASMAGTAWAMKVADRLCDLRQELDGLPADLVRSIATDGSVEDVIQPSMPG